MWSVMLSCTIACKHHCTHRLAARHVSVPRSRNGPYSPRVHKNKIMQRLISSPSLGHWHGEISSNVTFVYCTKWCIGVVVLRGSSLTHVRNLSMKPKPFYRAFSFFFLRENSQRGCIRVRKLGDRKANTHSQQWERQLQEKGLALGAESYVTS